MYAVVVTQPVESASNITDVARRESPVPPKSSLQYKAPKPNSADFLMTSTGNIS